MVIAYHVIWTTYGFWMPNEERGSWSTEVWAKHLRRFGPATKVDTHRSLARKPYNRDRRRAMRAALKYPAVRLTGRQAQAAASGIGSVARSLGLVVVACAVMPDHVHVVVLRHALTIEDIAQRMMSAATRCMTRRELHPLERFRDATGRAPSPWAEGAWTVYLMSPDEVLDRIGYVNTNPTKAGLRAQRWRFVRPYTVQPGRPRPVVKSGGPVDIRTRRRRPG